MSNNHTTLTVAKPETSLAEFSSDEFKAMARRIKYMISGGKQLSDPEAHALASVALATGLNPFTKEIQYIPGVGPEIGKQGIARKNQEQLEYEAERAGYRNPVTIEIDERDATEAEVGMKLGPEDVAVYVELTDSLTTSDWITRFENLRRDLSEGMGKAEAVKLALDIMGRKPRWTGVGVVWASEKFGGQGRPEMYARRERAVKRATKQASQKRFPRLELPDLQAIVEAMPGDWTEVEPERGRSGKSAEQLIGEITGDGWAEPEVEGEYREQEQPPAPAKTVQRELAPREKTNGKKSEQVIITDWMMEQGYAENDFAAKGIFDLLDFKHNGDTASRQDQVRIYRTFRDQGVEAKEAARMTLAGKLPEADPETA